MTARKHKLPEEFSLLNSEFNAFLFAPIGEEENNNPLTVLSAMSRQGIDPWQQAARLNWLPREVAAHRLGLMIETLPNGRWPKSEAAVIAERLVGLLPRRPTASLTRPARRVLDLRPRLSGNAKMVIYASLIVIGIAYLAAIH